MNLKPLKLPLIILCSLAFLIAITSTAQAQSFLPSCVSEGYCSLCDIMQLAINFGKFLLGIVGSLALLMFVYGGFMWLTSGGEASRIDAGKKILVNSVIGVAITFFAWVVVAFVVSTLTAGNASFKWDVTLTCAPLPGLEPIDVEIRDTGVGETQGTKKEGEACAHSSECDKTLYCDKTSKTCTKKILIVITEDPATSDKKCDGAEIDGKDDVACREGRCCSLLGALGFDCTLKRRGYCVYSGDVAGGEDCTEEKKCATGLYCQTKTASSPTGDCQNKLEFGKQCRGTMIVGGDPDDMCASGDCVDAICMPEGQNTQLVGQVCKDISQCKNWCGNKLNLPGLSGVTCAPGETWCKGTENADTGICTDQPVAEGQPCDDVAITSMITNFNGPCESGFTCKDGICKVKTN